MRKFANLLDMKELGIVSVDGKIPDSWQRKFIAAGAKGRIPLDTYQLDDGREVLNVADLDVEELKHPDGRTISQQAVVHGCGDIDELEEFLEGKAKNDRRQIEKAILRQSESDIGG